MSLDNSAATASSLNDAKTLIMDDVSMASMLSTQLQLDTKVSNLQDDLKKISLYVCKESQKNNKYKQKIENLEDELKVKDDNFERQIAKCKEDIHDLSQKLNTSEVVIFERGRHIVTYIEELQNMQKLLTLKFDSLEIITKKSKTANQDFSKEVQSLCSMTQESINRLHESEEREYALQADVDSIKLKLEYIEADMKKQEQNFIPKNIRAQFEREISEWENDSSTFVATRATHHIQKCLLFNNCVVVTGSSGCGKSSNIHHAALHLRDSFGYEIIPVLTGPTDIINYLNERKKQVFVVDDICGKETINTQAFMMWRDFAEQIEKIFRMAEKNAEHKIDGAVSEVLNPKFLVSCRLHIYKESQFQLITALTKMECNLLSSELCLLREERMCIMQKYLPDDISKNMKSKLIRENIDFFPLLCKLSKDKTSADVIKHFTAPVQSITKNIKHIISSNKTQFCALVLCILFDDGFNTDWLKLKSVSEREKVKLENILKSFEINVYNEMSRDILKSSFYTLDGTFIKRSGRLYRMIHDKIYKMAAVICGQRLTECFMQYAPSLFIRDHFIFKSVTKNEANDDFIILSDDMEDEYFERLLSDLSNSVITSTFNNKQLIYPSFMCKLIRFFRRSNNAKELLKVCDTKVCRVMVKRENDCWSYLSTPLLESASSGYVDMVQFLIVFIKCNVNKVGVRGNTPLHEACQGGKTDVVKLLLENNANISLFNHFHESPLYVSCKGGYTDIVKLLLQKSVDVSQSNTYNESPLYAACERGFTDLVKLLLQNEASISMANTDRKSPLYAACNGGFTDLVKLLLQNKANVSLDNWCKESPLYAACKRGHTDTVELLLQNNADVSQSNCHGESPLYVACKNGCTDVVNLLLLSRAEVSLCDKQGQTPLYVASERGYNEIIKLLLKNSADIFQCNNDGASPLYVACTRKYPDTVRLLLQNNADVSQSNRLGESPLYAACKAGCIDTVKLLLKSFADVSHCSSEGKSPLHGACKKGYTEIAKLVLLNKAEVSLINKWGQSPLYVACVRGHNETIKLLLKNSADIFQCNNDGASPLYVACTGKYPDTVRLLLQNNADVSQPNRMGKSPLYAACKAGCIDTVKLLLKSFADVSHCNSEGESPLYEACKEGYTDIVKLLLQNNADIYQCNTGGKSPLFVACALKHTDTVRLLLDNKADVSQCEHEEGHSPLHVVCKNTRCDELITMYWWDNKELSKIENDHLAHFEIVKLLIAWNADVAKCDKRGQTPLDVARNAGCRRTLALLEEHLMMKSV